MVRPRDQECDSCAFVSLCRGFRISRSARGETRTARETWPSALGGSTLILVFVQKKIYLHDVTIRMKSNLDMSDGDQHSWPSDEKTIACQLMKTRILTAASAAGYGALPASAL